MTDKRMLVIAAVILATAFFAGCAEQDAIIDNDDENNGLPDEEVTESIDESEIVGENGEAEDSDDLIETDDLEENDLPQTEEFSSTTNPLQAFNEARENGIPIVLKFYADT